MLTAKGQVGDREAALSQGADEYMSKPFSPIEILARVKELLG
jgi:DNA-binding response OmpR family regulator